MRRKVSITTVAVPVFTALLTTWVFSGAGSDVPIGAREEAKLSSRQEIIIAACCARVGGKDIDGLSAAGNGSPEGIWSDGVTMWVADEFDEKLYAYDLASGQRAAKDFDALDAAGNGSPEGIWSDGTTMWVVDDPWFGEKVFAYDLSTMARDSDKDIDVLEPAGNDNPEGIWSDGTTMWVADHTDVKLYAYDMDRNARDPDKDINALEAAGNNHPQGIWSDGATIWVSDYADAKIYAYKLTSRARDPDKDVDSLAAAGNSHPVGVWSDGATMWVADYVDKKLYAYNLPSRGNAPAILSVAPGIGALTVSWTPASSGGPAVSAYDLRYILSDAPDKADANWTVLHDVWTTGSGTLVYVLTGLTGGVRYDVQLRAVTSDGYAPWSPVRIGTPLVRAPASTDFNG